MNSLITKTLMKYKIGFYLILFLLACSLTLLNYIYTKYGANKIFNEQHDIKITNSLSFSQKHNGTPFPVNLIYNVLNTDTIQSHFSKKSVIVLLSNSGCNPCQIRELKLMDSLFSNYRGKANFLAIYDGINNTEPLLLRKVSKAKFSFYRTLGSAYSDYVGSKTYPVIFLVENQTVIFNYLPISNNEKFSKWSIKLLSKLL